MFPVRTAELASLLLLLALAANIPTHAAAAKQPRLAASYTKEEGDALVAAVRSVRRAHPLVTRHCMPPMTMRSQTLESIQPTQSHAMLMPRWKS